MSACSSPRPAAATGPITAGERNYDVATVSLAAGRHTFEVTNTAGQVTEVYVYAAGDRIMGEVENVGPATKRNLIVDLPAGEYQVAGRPGVVGDPARSGGDLCVRACADDPRPPSMPSATSPGSPGAPRRWAGLSSASAAPARRRPAS